MPKYLRKRADDIVSEEGGVEPQTRYIQYHWKVKQRSGEFADVFLSVRNGKISWSCCAVDKDRKWGCILRKDMDQSKPYCSHTLAAQMALRKKGALDYEDPEWV